MKKKSIFLIMSFLIGLGFGLKVYAYDYPTPFVIDQLRILADGHYRIVSNDGAAQCSGGPTGPAWSYVNTGDSGAKGKNAALLLAYAQRKTVELVTENVDGYCHIVDIWIY